MGTLSGQSISDTYDGLLKLEDSTTGITSTYQQIQDGLGNDTNTKISTQGILSPTIPTIISGLKPDFCGVGFLNNSVTNIAGIQNKTLNFPFYDAGFLSYSAISYSTSVATTIGDVVSVAFYSLQLVPTIGYAPKDLIVSGITLTVNSTGFKTTTLPSTLSFSGTGGGYYIAAFYITNSGATPTVRFGGVASNSLTNPTGYASLGFVTNAAGNSAIMGTKSNNLSNGVLSILNLPFQTSYTPAEITTNYNTTVLAQSQYGFALNTIK